MSHLRATALIAGGALSVHELRYALAGNGVEEPVAGHGYLPLVSFTAAVLLVLALAHLVARVRRARRGGPTEPAGPGLGAAWLIAAVALVAIFATQELFENLFTTGRTGGLDAVFASGGWTAVPLAAGIGGVIALALTAARGAVAAAARSPARPRRPRPPSVRRPGTRPVSPRRTGVLAAHLAGRAPPAAS